MTGLSNPKSAAGAGGAAYTKALLDLLGDREPFGVMEELPAWVAGRIKGLARQRRGPESVEHIIRMLAGHDPAHRRQLERILAGS